MIPLRDNLPKEGPALVVVTATILCAVVFVYQQFLTPRGLFEFMHLYGLTPARFTNPSWAAWAGFPESDFEPFATYMFLHGDWLHFLLNMWVLWVFADNVEDAMGHGRFAAFYLLCGILAGLTHIVFNWRATVPVVGASGAIAGVMGAYFRLFPKARVVTLIPIIIIPYITELPAVAFLGIWFLIQLFSGLFDATAGGGASSVAFWAHAGGFVAGALLARPFARRDCRTCYDPDRRRYDRLPL